MSEVGERELLAIIFTDAVDSTARTASDEDYSLRILLADLDYMRNEAAVRGGTVLKNTGDGLLISFKSAVDAVECALSIQKGFADRAENAAFIHKIGVHIGDVVKKDGDIYGSGVNTASRLVAQCPPGGICMSSTLYELVKQKSQIGNLKVENFQVTNIEPPIKAYRLNLAKDVATAPPKSKKQVLPFILTLFRSKSWIGVCAFLVLFSLLVVLKIRNPEEAESCAGGPVVSLKKNDPFLGRWKWNVGLIRIVTADRICDEGPDPVWFGKWEKLHEKNKYRFNYGTKENPFAFVVIGTLNEDGTVFEGMNQLGENKDRGVKIGSDDGRERLFMGHRYIFVPQGKKWNDANQVAKNMGGHLVTITSNEEQAYLEEFLRSQKDSGNRTWLGFSDNQKEGQWEWVTGEEAKFTNWGPGQPDNGFGSQNYAWIGWYGNGLWDDGLEGWELPFFVEIEPQPILGILEKIKSILAPQKTNKILHDPSSRELRDSMDSAVVRRLASLQKAGKTDLAGRLEGKIKKAWDTCQRYPGSHVIVGQVRLADGKKDVRLANAQMEILEEGLFAGEVRDFRSPVGFALQGYLPNQVELEGRSGRIVDVGEITLQPLLVADSASLKLKITGAEQARSYTQVQLFLEPGFINTPHNGTSPRLSPGWEPPLELRPDEQNEIQGLNLSPGHYYLKISSPEALDYEKRIVLSPGQKLDMGTINLIRKQNSQSPSHPQ